MKTRAYFIAALGLMGSLCFAVAKDNPLESICLQNTKNGLLRSLDALYSHDSIAVSAQACNTALGTAFTACKKTTQNATSTGNNVVDASKAGTGDPGTTGKKAGAAATNSKANAAANLACVNQYKSASAACAPLTDAALKAKVQSYISQVQASCQNNEDVANNQATNLGSTQNAANQLIPSTASSGSSGSDSTGGLSAGLPAALGAAAAATPTPATPATPPTPLTPPMPIASTSSSDGGLDFMNNSLGAATTSAPSDVPPPSHDPAPAPAVASETPVAPSLISSTQSTSASLSAPTTTQGFAAAGGTSGTSGTTSGTEDPSGGGAGAKAAKADDGAAPAKAGYAGGSGAGGADGGPSAGGDSFPGNYMPPLPGAGGPDAMNLVGTAPKRAIASTLPPLQGVTPKKNLAKAPLTVLPHGKVVPIAMVEPKGILPSSSNSKEPDPSSNNRGGLFSLITLGVLASGAAAKKYLT